MQNRQLERELRSLVQGLKGTEIVRVMEALETTEGFFLNKMFTKSGINCTCCTLTQEKLTVTGFGRNQQEAFINAAKNYLETLVTTNTRIPQLKNALRLRESTPKPQPVIEVQAQETLQLEQSRLGEISVISESDGCGCIYYQVHKHHMAEIRNMQARMKLIVKQNEMLKQLLLRDVQKNSKSPDKENMGLCSNLKSLN